MAVSWMEMYRALLLFSTVVGLFLLYQAARYRDRPGARPLFVLVTGALVYVVVKLVVSAVRGTPAVFVVTRFNPLGAGLATVGFFLVVVEYTGVEHPVSKRTAAGVSLVPGVVTALVLVDLEYLWIPVGTDPTVLSGYAWELTGVALANQLYMTVLLLAGIGLLVRRWSRSPNVFTVQIGALVIAAVMPLAGNIVFQFGYVPFNMAPVMFVVSGALIAWATLFAGFLDLAPVGKETVLDELDAGVLTLDDDHRVVDINERGCQLFDVDDADRVVGTHADELFADQRPFAERYWKSTGSDSGRDSSLEFDGRYYTVDVVELGTAGETMQGRSVIVRDVTDQKHRERELVAARESAETIIEASPVPIWVQGVEDIRYANDAAAKLFDVADADTLVGSSALSFVPEAERERTRERNLRMLENDESLPEMTGTLTTADGETRDALFAAAPIRYHGERSIVTIATDITERRERERKLEETKARLEQSNRKLEQFAGVVSHDLRNPLQVASARLELFREAKTEAGAGPEADEHLVAAERSLDRMEAMIEDLLHLSRAGETVDDPEALRLAGVALESWETAQTEAAEIDLAVPDATTVLADRDRLRQVFENLFRNAVDHNDSAVSVRVGLLGDREAATDGGQRTGFFIEDDGVGIPADERDEIFEHGHTTSSDGTGFGLSIVRDIVEAHDWEIRVTAGTNGGARFEITGVDTGR